MRDTKGASSYNEICTNFSDNIRLKKNVTEIGLRINVDDEFLKSSLVNYGPLVAGVCGSDFNFMFVGSNGIVDSCDINQNLTLLNHAILIVGYTSTHWIIKNSWGPSWGDKGFAYVSRASDCGLKMQVTIFVANSNLQPPPSVMTNISVYLGASNVLFSWGKWVYGIEQNGVIVSSFSYQ